MPRKLTCRPLASALGIALTVMIMVAFASAGAVAAPGVPPAAGAAVTVQGASFANINPVSPQPAPGAHSAISFQPTVGAAPTGGIVLAVNYAHEWVMVDSALPGAQLHITVERGGNVLSTLSVVADPSGSYRSQEHEDWVPERPDIQIGDSVRVTAGGVTAAVDPVGEIAGTLDVATSTVSGVLHAPALAPSALTVVCEVWVEGASVSPIVKPNVAADGGAYACNFGTQGFQVAPGNDIAVRYYEPDGDQVINVFRAPASDVKIDIWSEGSSVAAAGGRSLFHIRYQNNGDAPADGVVVTDTLAANVTFVQGTAPVAPEPPEATPGQVVWHLGTLDPGEAGHFFVVLANTLAAGATLENRVTISASSPGDSTGDNQSSVSVPVESGQPDVWVDQGLSPGDPLPGDSYRIDLNYGTNNSLPVGPVQLHLQLPQGTTLQSWASQNGYDQLWTLISSVDNELIFEAPALPGGFGDQLLVRASVASTVGENGELTSTAWIEAPSDANSENNGPISRSVWTSLRQRPDLSIHKQWGYGTLAPGGSAWYNIDYSNDGNLIQSSVWLTDTLPSGTRFVEATVDSNWGFSRVEKPDYQSGNVVAWDLGTLAPAQWGQLKVRLALDGVAAGATITNTAQITGLDHDRTWGNNHAEAVERVNSAGANLRVRQNSYWQGSGEIRFELLFENAGTTIVDSVRITDTVPEGLDFSGDWWSPWWGGFKDYSYDPETRQIVWTINRLEPAWAGVLNFLFKVPQGDVGRQGLRYANEAQITLPPGEVSPADNRAREVIFTGPDLFVHQSLWAGKVAPGAVVTFMVDFGNANNGPWNTGQPAPDAPGVVITDTLPAGMTFVSATSPWEPGAPWEPQQDGNKLTWALDGLCASCRSQSLVTVRIADTVRRGTNLTNLVEIRDLVPGDVDPVLGNNTSSWSYTIPGKVYLPLTRK